MILVFKGEYMKTILKVFKFLSLISEDIFIFIGVVLISKAGFMIYKPLGYAVLGLFLLVFGLFLSKRPLRPPEGR
jgi:hypothetical protein